MADVNATLIERGNRYGDFAGHAQITQNLKKAMRETPGWDRLTPSMQESLEMNAHKVGRILNGDPTYADSWHDIAGYAKLVEDELNGPATTEVVRPLASLPPQALNVGAAAAQIVRSEQEAVRSEPSPVASVPLKPAGSPLPLPAGGALAPAGGPLT